MKLSQLYKSLSHLAILFFAAILLPLALPAQDKKPAAPPPAKAPAAAPKPATAPAAHPNTTTPTRPGATTPNRPGTSPNLNSSNGHGPTTPGVPGAKGPATNTAPKSVGTTPLANGGKSVTTSAGHTVEYNKTGQVNKVVTKSGAVANFDSRGKVSTIKTVSGTTITHIPGGGRQLVTEHRGPNGKVESRIVSTGANRGYAEHTFQRGGNEYVRRTYVYGGRTNVYVYRTYYYGGNPYYYYVPPYYYYPAYYGWAYNPWAAPVYYNWGWGASPWYRPYGYYFSPYPSYPSAAFWLTDYLIAENLRAAYEANAAANAANYASSNNANDNQQAADAPQGGQQAQSSAPTLSPEVKQMIAEEVKAQLAAEQAAAAETSAPATAAPQQPAANTDKVPPALDPNLRVFIVATNLDVTSNGQTCSLSAGDVLMRTENAADKDNLVGVNVVSAKKSDCGTGSSQRVQVADLQEMHNHFREQLGNGLRTLSDNEGKNGIPAGPAAGGKPNREGTAAADLTASADLDKQKQEADQAEQEVQQASASTSNAGGQH